MRNVRFGWSSRLSYDPVYDSFPKILPHLIARSSSANLIARKRLLALPYIIKLMLNEWLYEGVISGRSYRRCIILAVNSRRLFIQGVRRATVGSRESTTFLIGTRDRSSSSLSLTLSFASSATLDHAKFSNSCHRDPVSIFSYNWQHKKIAKMKENEDIKI